MSCRQQGARAEDQAASGRARRSGAPPARRDARNPTCWTARCRSAPVPQRTRKCAATARRVPLRFRRSRTGTSAQGSESSIRTRDAHVRCALLRASSAGRRLRASADRLHARAPHARARRIRDRAAISGERTALVGPATSRSSSRICSRCRRLDLFLIPTAEVPLTNLHRGEILDGRQLPLRYTAYTPCSGAKPAPSGRTCAVHPASTSSTKWNSSIRRRRSQSYTELEKLTAGRAGRARAPRASVSDDALVHGGHGAERSRRPYDIEVWLPRQDTYREIRPAATSEAFQARRANIRFRADGTGKAEFVHTLNGSGLAVGRTLVAILENYQRTRRIGGHPRGAASVHGRRRAARGRESMNPSSPIANPQSTSLISNPYRESLSRIAIRISNRRSVLAAFVAFTP